MQVRCSGAGLGRGRLGGMGEHAAVDHQVSTPGFALGTYGPVVVTVWAGTTQREALDALPKAQHAFRAGRPRFATLSLLEGGFATPEPWVRERSLELQREFQPYLIASATVVRAKGLAGVLARTFLVGFTLLDQGKVPTRIFKSLEEAVAWLGTFPECGSLGVPTEVAAQLDAYARAQLGGPK